MSHLAISAPGSSTLPEQRVRLVIEAEIFTDPDGGPDSLIATTDAMACEPVCPARMLSMVAAAEAKLADIKRLAKVFEARDTLAAIIAEHDLKVEEWDTADLDPSLRERLEAWHWIENGEHVVAVPKGQDVIERLNAITSLVTWLERQQDQA